MELYIYQQFYIKCLILEYQVHNFIEALESFKKRFPNNHFKLSEDKIRKLKSSLIGNVNNLDIEQLCNTITHKN